MNGYVLGGYIIVLGSVGTYALSLVARLRSAKRRAQVVRAATEQGSS